MRLTRECVQHGSGSQSRDAVSTLNLERPSVFHVIVSSGKKAYWEQTNTCLTNKCKLQSDKLDHQLEK